MVRRGGLLLVLSAGLLTGCSVDRVEWESRGFPVEEVGADLEQRHGAKAPRVECIKREVGGAVWECRARSGEARYECEVKVGPRERIRSLECGLSDEEPAAEEARTAAWAGLGRRLPGTARECRLSEGRCRTRPRSAR
jgi:hypothetical protein